MFQILMALEFAKTRTIYIAKLFNKNNFVGRVSVA